MPLLFAYGINMFSHDVAHFLLNHSGSSHEKFLYLANGVYGSAIWSYLKLALLDFFFFYNKSSRKVIIFGLINQSCQNHNMVEPTKSRAGKSTHPAATASVSCCRTSKNFAVCQC